MLDDHDRALLQRCIELADRALRAGHRPFGALLADHTGRVLFEEHNRAGGGDSTRHAEFALARWAVNARSAEERAQMTVYTSTEHCPMCAAAHGWAGLGRIVFATSTLQVRDWLSAWAAPGWPVAHLRITEVVPHAIVDGPSPELAGAVRELHRRHHHR